MPNRFVPEGPPPPQPTEGSAGEAHARTSRWQTRIAGPESLIECIRPHARMLAARLRIGACITTSALPSLMSVGSQERLEFLG